MKEKKTKTAGKRPIYKKWWFWLILLFILGGAVSGGGEDDRREASARGAAAQTATAERETQAAVETEAKIKFHVSKVRNDVTGNWRIATIAENVRMHELALSYYREYFESDAEIHGIVNFQDNTTTKIMVVGNLLDVCVYDYVDKEEHDAKLLFSGALREEYFVNLDSGETEQIQ